MNFWLKKVRLSHGDFRNIQTLADVGRPGAVHDHGPEAGALPRLQIGDMHQPGPVIVAPWKVAQQVPQCPDAQLLQLLGLGGAHAPEHGHGVRQLCHKYASFFKKCLYNEKTPSEF